MFADWSDMADSIRSAIWQTRSKQDHSTEFLTGGREGTSCWIQESRARRHLLRGLGLASGWEGPGWGWGEGREQGRWARHASHPDDQAPGFPSAGAASGPRSAASPGHSQFLSPPGNTAGCSPWKPAFQNRSGGGFLVWGRGPVHSCMYFSTCVTFSKGHGRSSGEAG